MNSVLFIKCGLSFFVFKSVRVRPLQCFSFTSTLKPSSKTCPDLCGVVHVPYVMAEALARGAFARQVHGGFQAVIG